VFPSGGKLWRLRYKKFNRSLGAYPEVSLGAAREKASEMRRLIKTGLDPSASPVKGLLFEELAGQWREKFLGPPLAPATIKRKTFVLEKHILPALGPLPVNEITPAVVLERLLRPLETRGLLETALRAREMTGTIFRFGIASALTDKDPTIGLQGAVKPPVQKHHPGITDPARLGALLRAIESYPGNILVRVALKLLPLVFVRPGELIRSQWDEFDWQKNLWTIPAPKMKMRLPHVVPLVKQTLYLLEYLRGFSGPEGFLFPNMRHRDRPMSENTLNAALRAMGFGPDEVVSHGFRTTASTLLNERGYRPDLIERQLSHVERNAVRGAYNRAEFLEERRAMMADWAVFLDELKGSAA
jgi:integrase